MTTAIFLRVGPRLIRIGLLALCAIVMAIITAQSLPVTFSLPAVGLMILASLAFLLSPAALEPKFDDRRFPLLAREPGSETAIRWNDNAT